VFIFYPIPKGSIHLCVVEPNDHQGPPSLTAGNNHHTHSREAHKLCIKAPQTDTSFPRYHIHQRCPVSSFERRVLVWQRHASHLEVWIGRSCDDEVRKPGEVRALSWSITECANTPHFAEAPNYYRPNQELLFGASLQNGECSKCTPGYGLDQVDRSQSLSPE
jgi:hypothetical protein